jgi:signal transduction histidine kinase/CheY-like chemotaxis protein
LGPASPRLIAAVQRRPKLLILAFTASILIAVAALESADLWWRRERTIAAAERRARNLSFVLAEYVRGTFAAADASVRQLVIHGRRVGGATAPEDAWAPMLSAAKAALGGGSLTVTDATGRILHSTQHLIVGQSRSDNYIFKELSTITHDELIVDRPFLSVVEPRKYLLPIGRRLTRDDGTFDGTVVATVIPDAFREFFRTLDVGRDGIIWVFHPDGVVIFREPSATDAINQSADTNPLWLAAKGPADAGLLHQPLQADGQSFLSVYRRVSTPPLIVGVSLSDEEILDDWQHQRQVTGLALGALAVTLGGIVLILFRQIDARGRVERALAEQEQLEAVRLREANERLEQSLEREQRARRETEAASYLKDEFLMTVSHELRTPLTAIYGWVRMLASDTMPRDQQLRALAAVERNARAQTRLIDDLLDVSRAISGKLRLEARPVNVADVVLAAAETLGPALQAKSIRLESVLDPDVGPVMADPDRLQQIVWNLLSNAIKFTPERGVVRLRLARIGSQIEIVVSDTGSGIPKDFLPHVFERFRQAEAGTRRRYGGMGLGLAIVRHLVELHGGTVSAESAGEGQGSTFRVLLPARSGTPAAAPDRAEPARPVAGIPIGRLDGIHILVVDDEGDSRELFASILEAAGARVRTAASATDAVDVLRVEPANVLLSDIEMPDEDGYQLLRRIKADDRLTNGGLVAIAVTAHAREADRRRALEAGFDGHLPKPVEPSELIAIVASLATSRLV